MLVPQLSPPAGADALSMLTPRDVAARLRLSEKTVRRALKAGALRAAKFGSVWRIRTEDADAWFEANVPPVDAGRRHRERPPAPQRGTLPSLTAIESKRS